MPDLLFGDGGAVVLVASGGTVVGWSRGAEGLFGYRADEVVGGSVGRVLIAPAEPGGTPAAGDRVAAGCLRAPAVKGAADPGADEDWFHTRLSHRGLHATDSDGRRSWLADARHRDGRTVRVALEGVPLAGPAGGSQWLLTASAMSEAERHPARNPVLLRALMERAPLALAVWDSDLRCVWLNSIASEQTGQPWVRRLGRDFSEALRGFDLGVVEPMMRRVLETGEPVVDHELSYVSAEGRQRAFSASIFRLDGADGTPVGVCTVGIDVHDSKARRRLSLLSSAGTRVGNSLSITTTAQELCDVAVSHFADFVTVDLADWVPLGEVPRERPGASAFGRPAFRRAGLASIREGAPEAIFAAGEVVHQPPSSPVVKAMLTGRSTVEYFMDTSEYWARNDPVRAHAMKRAGMHSAMAVPLKARGAVLGVATFIRTDNPATFNRDDLLLAEELVQRAALSLDNARRYSRERATALALQRDLLPQRVSGGASLDVATRYLPADTHERVGGDWFDVIRLTGGRVALVVGDVVGHGINAAATMGRLRTAVHTLARLEQPPHILLANLDELALRLSEEARQGDELDMAALAASCVYAVYDPASRTCTFARAGHPPPALVTPGGDVSFPESPPGALVGWGLADYASVEMPLSEGSRLVLYTDGLVETRTQDLDTGLARLADALCRTEDELDACCTRIIETMTSGITPQDDIALLIARTTGA